MIDRNIISNIRSLVESVDSEKKLADEKNIFNKKHIAPIYGQIKDKSPVEKKDFVQIMNILKSDIDKIFDDQLNRTKEQYNNSLRAKVESLSDVSDLLIGGNNPIEASIKEINNFFKVINFVVVSGPEISSS